MNDSMHFFKPSYLVLAALLFFTSQSFLCLPANADDHQEVNQIAHFRDETLAIHLNAITLEQQQALAACYVKNRNPHVLKIYSRVYQFRKYALPLLNEQPKMASIFLMDAYRIGDTMVRNKKLDCYAELKKCAWNRKKAARKSFQWIHQSAALSGSIELQNLLLKLDPNCVIESRADFQSTHAGNACIAGVNPILETVAKRDAQGNFNFDHFILNAQKFIKSLNQSIQNSMGHPSLDLADLRSGQSWPEFLALWAWMWSANYPEVGSVDQFGDALWMHAIRRGLSAETAYHHYTAVSNAINWTHALIRHDARVKNINIKMDHVNIKNWNNHEAMSAFLACDFAIKNQPQLATLIPQAMGMVYETLDFKSHLNQGMSWSDSFKNFKTDIIRHTTGADFGLQRCNF
jgi:hypothetical protein